jgi:O-antigen/teichoic acid export membrane protein
MGCYDFKPHLKAVAIFFAMACATTIYTNLDTVMLGFMKSDDDVGFYNAAVRIKSILVSIVTSLGTVLLPRASYYVEHGQMEEFRKISRKALNFVVMAATPLMLYFIFFSKQGILLLSGDDFLGSVLPMQIIMPTLLFIGLTNILGIQILVPTGREKMVLYSVMFGAAVDVVCNFLLIPRFAATGAAVSNMLAEAAVLVFQLIALRKEVLSAFRSISYWKLGAGLLAGTVASVWVTGLGLGSFWALALSACLFFGAYGLVLLVLKEELVCGIFGQFFGKIRKKL